MLALEGVLRAGEVGVTSVMDNNGDLVDVGPEEALFACLSTLPMGWSWALFFCHSILTKAMVVAAQRTFNLMAEEASAQAVVDRRPSPVLGVGRPLLAPYVDNANPITWDYGDAEMYTNTLSQVFAGLGLAFGVEARGTPTWDTIGLHLDALRILLLNKPSRIWRLQGALLEL